jgi:plastocyanin
MNAQRIAGITALASGALLIVTLIVATVAGPTAFGTTTSPFPMGGAGMGAGHMGNGMMGMGSGMMGPGMMGPGMMGFGASGPAATPIPGALEVRVQASNFAFSPAAIRLPKNADVTLTFTNPSSTGAVHDLTVPALGIHVVANAGETKSIGLRGLAAGRYDAYCSVPGHAELGMRATVIVE